LEETQKWKEVIKENRNIREQQIEARKIKDKEESDRKRKEIVENEVRERRIKAQLLQQSIVEKESARLTAKQQKREELCSEITTDLIRLALEEIHMKTMLEGKDITEKIRSDLYLRFVKGERIEERDDFTEDNETNRDTLAAIEFSNYIQYQGSWRQYAKYSYVLYFSYLNL
jgi:septal ring factor EnvC (AmiA/AmiB activator)